MLIFASEQKKVSVFNLDILCIPVNSPGVLYALYGSRIFPGACRTANSSGRFIKIPCENGMLGNARYVFQNFD